MVPVDAFKSLRIPSWKLEAYSPNGGVRNYSNEEDHQHKVRCNTQRVERFPIARLSCPLKDMVVHVQVVVLTEPSRRAGFGLRVPTPRGFPPGHPVSSCIIERRQHTGFDTIDVLVV